MSTFYVGTRKGFFPFSKTDTGWTMGEPSFLGDSVPMFLPDPRDGTLYAAVEHGHFGTKMHRSENAGSTWTELDPPTYPPKPDDVPDTINTMSQKVIPWSLEKVWSLEPGKDGSLWCGTIPGGLFQSTDRGSSWELNRALWDKPERSQWFGGGYDNPGIHSIEVNPADQDDIAVAISCGGVWRTRDGGKSWNQSAHGMFYEFVPGERETNPEIQEPHRTVRCPSAPDQMWTQHHGGIFRTTNDSETWDYIDDVAPSGFGFAVSVHPKDPETAWFVPAKKDEFRYPTDGKLVVNKTTDGGKTFISHDTGLPPSPAYDLVYRHGLDVDDSGDLLVMGSTTGSIWISEDGGESWENLSTHLPPIYCVRFAKS